MVQESGPRPAQRLNFSQTLAGSLVGAAGVAPHTEDAEPLHQQSSLQLNRDQFRESQRLVAAQMLAYSLPILVCMCLLMLGLAIAGITIYIKGWMVWCHNREKTCDQPLKWWLLTMLLMPVIQCQANWSAESRVSKFQVLVMPLLIAVGAWLCLRSKTCHKTNPPLYDFVRMYLIYQTSVWVLVMFILFGLVALIFWLHRHGLLETGPGPAMAAKPGLIDEIETVPYSPSLFQAGKDNGAESSECCICQEEFSSSSVIKQTPCGHLFHGDCLGTWLGKYARICPLCRTDLEEAVEQRVSANA